MSAGEAKMTGARRHVRIQLFGALRVVSGDGADTPITNARSRAMLGVLCLQPDAAMERAELCRLLWPGRFEAQARASLRQCLLVLGKDLGPCWRDLIDADRSLVRLRRDAVITDLDELESSLKSLDVAAACALFARIGARPLLEHLEPGPTFAVWIKKQRVAVEQMIEGLVLNALDALARANQSDAAAALIDGWKKREPNAVQKAAFGKLGGKLRIAVLPFAQFDAVGGDFFLADGVTDELITMLGRVPELLVAGRTSSSQFQQTRQMLPEIATALNVTHLVEGSVTRTAEQVRIVIRLVDGCTGFEIRTWQFDESMDAIFADRAAIASNVTGTICAALGLDAAQRPARPMTSNREAYRLYLQGRALTMRAIGDGVLDTAIQFLEQAVALDADFAEGWTALAEAHAYKTVYTPCPDRVGESARMAEYATIAITKAPDQGHARAMLGIHQWTLGNPTRALELAHEACRLEPENPDVLIRLGSFLLYIGRTRDAAPYIEGALDQDPVHGRNHALLSTLRLNCGDIEGAIAAGQRMTDLGFPSMWHAMAILASGDHARAVDTYRQTRRLMNTVIFPPAGTAAMSDEAMDAYWLMAAKGCCSGQAADRALYCQMLESLHLTMPDPHDPSIVCPAIWMGHATLAMKIYRERIHPANMFGLMSLWTDIEPVRQVRLHPDFMNFADDIGLVRAWERFGWPDLLPRAVDQMVHNPTN